MKKICKVFALILSVFCLAAFAACGSGNKNNSTSGQGSGNWDDKDWTNNY
jgi:hypothetical protein